jgi:ADP-heptose:LPS heptosyltransferase
MRTNCAVLSRNTVNFLKRLLRYAVFYAGDTLVRLQSGSTISIDRLLLIRLDAIGDFVIWLDSAKEFRRLYPNSRITLCTSSVVSELANTLPYWDEVVEVDLKLFNTKLIYRYSLLLRLRKQRFEIAIQPTFSRVFLHGDAIVRATGAKHRIGSQGDLTNTYAILKRVSDAWYTKLVPAATRPMMEVDRNAEFIENLSGQVFNAHLPALPKLGALSAALEVKAPYFVIFPGASWTGRQWPASKFAETVVMLHRMTGWVPVLCGGPGDKLVCQEVIDQCGVTRAIDFTGLTTVTELAQVLRAAKLLISNETSAVHIAVAVSTPSVCVLGGGHYGRFMPYPADIDRGNSEVAVHQMSCYNCNWHCTQPHVAGGPVPCIANVTVKSVLERIEAVLSRVQNQSSARSENLTR